jgi:hypothetical protein
MSRQGPSIGFLGKFGRSADLRQLDAALRLLDLHPSLVPEPIKVTVVNLLRESTPATDGAAPAYRGAAEILAYCMIGPGAFAGANGENLARQIERRIEAALETGDSLDARLILLTLHAKVIQPSVVDRFRLASEVEGGTG